MSTIQGFQVFSPIGFSMYPCLFTNLCKECDNCDVSQSSGYFDTENTDVISFYSRDYVEGKFFHFSLHKNLDLLLSFFSTKIIGIISSNCSNGQ